MACQIAARPPVRRYPERIAEWRGADRGVFREPGLMPWLGIVLVLNWFRCV
jgi:hypothetical protein